MRTGLAALIAGFVLLGLACTSLFAQVPASIAAGHRGAVNAIAYDGAEKALSAGDDGFLGVWNLRTGAAEDRFQISAGALVSLSLRPGTSQAAVVENRGLGDYRVSVWDYLGWKELFSRSFRELPVYMAYSAGGSFLMISRNSLDGIIFLDSETGEPLEALVLKVPGGRSSLISFAVTGKSERTMISYSPSGFLSYWDLASGEEISRFSAPANINSPLLFGNSRFFAGFEAGGLVVLDAVTGKELDRDRNIRRGILAAGSGTEFFCISGTEILRYGLSGPGKLEIRNREPLESAAPASAVVTGDGLILGSSNGKLFREGRPMETSEPLAVLEAAVSGPVLGFIAGDDRAGFIPLDFSLLHEGDTIILSSAGGFSRISPGTGAGDFIFWHDSSPRATPLIRRVVPDFPVEEVSRSVLGALSLRNPLVSASALGDRILFLDSAGTVFVLNAATGKLVFSYMSLGALDAVFRDESYILISRSSAAGGSPFLLVNMNNGETVPLAYPAPVGARLYRSPSGLLYGEVIHSGAGAMRSILLRLNTRQPAESVKLDEYAGEDTGFSMAESGGFLAATLGGGARLYTDSGPIPFERSPGLPLQLCGGGNWFITVDGAGNIVWHDNTGGRLLALLHLYDGRWLLESSGGNVRGGPLVRE
ncbi:MAG: WD40 repeat domain-containing protein [Treponema sp.]|jgi:WD40 repeat protein|nr:WD40 repeat domain-containing protein [Treponema sp.]